jgi:hypothetical protein
VDFKLENVLVSLHSLKTMGQDEAIDKNCCSCGHCALLPKQTECLCCKQFQHYDEHYITEDIPCISLHPDFDIICLNEFSPTSKSLSDDDIITIKIHL